MLSLTGKGRGQAGACGLQTRWLRRPQGCRPGRRSREENEAVAVGGILTLHITVDFFDTCIHVA